MINRLERKLDMVERHLQVLGLVTENDPIGIVKLSDASDYPTYKVRCSLRIHEEVRLVEPMSEGAVPTDRVNEFVTDLDEQLTASIDRLDALELETTATSNPNGAILSERHGSCNHRADPERSHNHYCCGTLVQSEEKRRPYANIWSNGHWQMAHHRARRLPLRPHIR